MKSRQTANPFGQHRPEIQSPDPEEVAALLRRVVELLDGLPERLSFALAVKRQAVGLTKADREFLAEVLPAIAGAVGEAVWTLHDLATEQPAVYALLSHLAGAGSVPNRAIGKRLARGESVAVDGLAVRRVGQAREGTLWRVARVS